jgi:hypothetical protein
MLALNYYEVKYFVQAVDFIFMVRVVNLMIQSCTKVDILTEYTKLAIEVKQMIHSFSWHL